MEASVNIVGAGLAGSEAALQLAERGVPVRLLEMRPSTATPVHAGGLPAELVCSNSLKSMRPEKPAGMLKAEMALLGSFLLECACATRVPAGGALAVDRGAFAQRVKALLDASNLVERVEGEALGIDEEGIVYRDVAGVQRRLPPGAATIVATGPLTADALAADVARMTGAGHLAFFDAAAPIVMADSLDHGTLFRQSRYDEAGEGDYLNAPFTKEEYERFIGALLDAQRVIARDFETKDLFCACQPVEEIARRGFDAPRHGMMKPVGLTDPRTGRRPYAAVQLRAEDAHATSYNLVGFQTNLTFPEQRRVFRLIPGLEQAEFARYGVMHRNTFIDAPQLLDASLRLRTSKTPLYFAGQVAGTEGYCEAIMSGLHAAISVAALVKGASLPPLPATTSFGSLMRYATNPETVNYQPMHVNFGVFPPLDEPCRNKGARYRAFLTRQRGDAAAYARALRAAGLLPESRGHVAALWSQTLAQAGIDDASWGPAETGGR